LFPPHATVCGVKPVADNKVAVERVFFGQLRIPPRALTHPGGFEHTSSLLVASKTIWWPVSRFS